MPETIMIMLESIGYDKRYYPRVNGEEDWMTVHRYTDALLSDPKLEFPPVTVVRATAHTFPHLLIDGKHRVKAYTRAGRKRILANVERIPMSKWFARSVELNATHGRPFDVGDKAWVAVRLEEDGFSLEEAAKLLHMRPESLEKIKAEHVVKLKAKATLNIPEGRGNRSTNGKRFGFLKAPFKDFAGTTTAATALAAQDAVSSQSAVNVLDSAIAVLECGVDMTDEEIRARIERLRVLLKSVGG